jgi:hypothetical protein
MDLSEEPPPVRIRHRWWVLHLREALPDDGQWHRRALVVDQVLSLARSQGLDVDRRDLSGSAQRNRISPRRVATRRLAECIADLDRTGQLERSGTGDTQKIRWVGEAFAGEDQ